MQVGDEKLLVFLSKKAGFSVGNLKEFLITGLKGLAKSELK